MWRSSDISRKQFTLKRIQWLQHIVIYIYRYIYTHASIRWFLSNNRQEKEEELKRKGITDKSKNSSYHQGLWTQTDNLKLKHFIGFTQRPLESKVWVRLLEFTQLPFHYLQVRKKSGTWVVFRNNTVLRGTVSSVFYIAKYIIWELHHRKYSFSSIYLF